MPHPFVTRLLDAISEKIEECRDGLERDLAPQMTAMLRGQCAAWREAERLVEEADKSVFGEVDDLAATEDKVEHERDRIDAGYLPGD